MISVRSNFLASDMYTHLDRLRRCHPDLYDCIDVERARQWAHDFELTTRTVDDFGDEQNGGRGGSYIRAQALNLSARARGINQLLGFIRSGTDSARQTVIDVLGGDGLVQRVAGSLGMSDLAVLTCDVSPYMVRAAWSADSPALLQRADRLLQRDKSVDGVLIAYGSHHIAPKDRAEVVRECYRVLRPGGVLVLHDFLVGSQMDEWFSKVVDPYSMTGHQFEHFTHEQMCGYLSAAGFDAYEVIDMADPYVASGVTQQEAELALGRYLLDMYGLVKIDSIWGDQADRWVIEQAEEIFRYPNGSCKPHEFTVVFDASSDVWRSTIPRMAVVGIGRKAP
jgi:ubiquinone/menaquinone biosynthesis C-methylase UbiE